MKPILIDKHIFLGFVFFIKYFKTPPKGIVTIEMEVYLCILMEN